MELQYHHAQKRFAHSLGIFLVANWMFMSKVGNVSCLRLKALHADSATMPQPFLYLIQLKIELAHISKFFM